MSGAMTIVASTTTGSSNVACELKAGIPSTTAAPLPSTTALTGNVITMAIEQREDMGAPSHGC